jgi:hypothetical protein
MAAVGADAMRQGRLVALRAILDLRRLGVMMAAPVALLRLGGTPLRYGHDFSFLRAKTAQNQG